MLTLKIEKQNKTIEIYPADAEETMYWDEATEYCKNLQEGWRLPDSDELKAIHQELFLKNIGDFKRDGGYWSSSEFDVDPNKPVWSKAWVFIFENTCQSYALAKRGKSAFDVPYKFSVRPVRDI